MKLTEFPNMVLLDSNLQTIPLYDTDIRYLLAWLCKYKPVLVKEVVCGECGEMADYFNYCENKAESG